MDDVRLIDANALKRQAVEVEIVTPPHNHYCSELVVFGYDIDEAPTIDAVPVVRCKECVYRGKDECPMYFDEWELTDEDMYFNIRRDHTEGDSFCHMGVKKDGGSGDA